MKAVISQGLAPYGQNNLKNVFLSSFQNAIRQRKKIKNEIYALLEWQIKAVSNGDTV